MVEEKLLIARVNDLFRLCEKNASAKFTNFLNENEQSVIREEFSYNENCMFFGGYEEAERCIFGVFPEWETERDFPIAILKAESKFSKKLSHRDYLGTILSLGLDRGKVGDILVCDNSAYIFVADEIADYVADNIKKIANCGVKIQKTDISLTELPKREYKEISAVCASLRMDAVLSSAMKLSRREAAMYINSGKVAVNHREITDVSHMLKVGDLLSVRGMGRVILSDVGSLTRGGKIHILLKKYVR